MKALFKVTMRQVERPEAKFVVETVIASSATEAIKKVEPFVKKSYSDEDMFASDVELVDVVTID